MLRFLGKLALSLAMIAIPCAATVVMKYHVLAKPAPKYDGQELLDELGIELPNPDLLVDQEPLLERLK